MFSYCIITASQQSWRNLETIEYKECLMHYTHQKLLASQVHFSFVALLWFKEKAQC